MIRRFNYTAQTIDNCFDFEYDHFQIGHEQKAGEKLDINFLREFVVITQTRNFVQAANVLFSSPSVLSKHLRKAESELGVRLFDRTSRKVEITDFGQLLLPYAKQIVELEDKYTTLIQSNLATTREILTLGSFHSLAQYNITEILGRYKKSRPKSMINIGISTSEELKEMLRQKKCELAFIRATNGVDKDLVKILFAVDTLAAVLPSDHPLAKQQTISMKMLANEDFLLPEKSSTQYRLCTSACNQSGFKPRVAHTDSKFENLIDLVTQGMGVALMWKQLARYDFNPKVSIVDISPSMASQIYLCYPKGVTLSNAAAHFIQCTRQSVEARTKVV